MLDIAAGDEEVFCGETWVSIFHDFFKTFSFYFYYYLKVVIIALIRPHCCGCWPGLLLVGILRRKAIRDATVAVILSAEIVLRRNCKYN